MTANVRFGSEADIHQRDRYVRFVPKADMSNRGACVVSVADFVRCRLAAKNDVDKSRSY